MAFCSRRRFLQATAGLAGASVCGFPAWGKDSEAGRAGGFILGLQSYSLRGYGVDEAVQHAHELGVGSMEFFSGHYALNSSAEEIARMTDKLKALGIKPLGHGVNGFSKDHEANRKVFEFARQAGIRNLSADPTEDSFDSLDKLVDEYQIRIAIHNHGPGARYDKVADVLTAIQGRHKLIGACADLGHYIRSGEDPVKAINLLKGRLFGIHLKDFAEPRGDAPGTILGKGQLDVVGVFKALKKVEFPADGALSLEYEEHPDNPLAEIGECLDIAREGAEKSASLTMFKVAGVQMDVRIGERQKNLARMEAALGEAARQGARLVVFPECALAGYCFESLAEARSHAEPLPGRSINHLAEACRELDVFAVMGLLEQDGDRTFNAAALVGPEGLVGAYRKIHLPYLGVDRFTTPGDRPFGVWSAGEVRVGMNICYDGAFPEAARVMALDGADLIVLPTNWPPGAECTAEFVINARALENNVYYMAVNRVGEERGFRFIGQSKICGPSGCVLAEAPADAETILFAEIDPALARRKRIIRVPGKHEIDRFADRRPDMYGRIVQK